MKKNGYKVDGLVLNLDDSRFLWPNAYRAETMTKEDALRYIDQYIGGESHVTDIVLTLNTSFVSMYNSETWENQLDMYDATEIAGEAVDFKNTQAKVMNRYRELGIDVWQLWVDHLWECGINPWMSFRMSDHHAHQMKSPLTSEFFWKNKDKYARVKHRNDLIYRGDRCFDFVYEEVRNKWLVYIEETVMKFNLYGIEFDWMRDPIFTSLGNELAAMDILTQFMRDAKALVKKAEEKWGHPILVCVRCPRDIQSCIEAGFDILKWCEEGIVNWLVPTAYYMSDYEIPVLTWKRVLAPYDVTLVPNVTMGSYGTTEGSRTASDISYYSQTPGRAPNVEMVSGTAYSYLAQGATKLYIFNIFGDCGKPIEEDEKVPTDEIFPISSEAERGKKAILWKFFCTCGSAEKIAHQQRRHTISFQDYSGLWGTPQKQLPKVVDRANKYCYLHFYTGEVTNQSKVTLLLGVQGEEDLSSVMKVFVNGTEVVYKGRALNEFPYTKDDTYLYAYEVDASAINGSVVVEFTTTEKEKPYTVCYAELVVDARG